MPRRSWTSVLFLGLAVGCGGPDTPVPVSGKVTLDGQPVAGAAIQFVPDGNGARRPASAGTESDGSYRITTHNPGDGALPGEYKVVITWEPEPPPQFRPSEDGPSRQEQQKAIEQYQAKKKKEGKGYAIPPIYSDPGKTPLRVKVPAPGGRADFELSAKTP
jgi:hypothetical protein